jgi:UDP-glucuronate decarboxylase
MQQKNMSQNTFVLLSDLADIHKALGPARKKFVDSTVLITGCAGFLGFYLVNYLVRYATELSVHKVIGLDNFMLAKPHWLEELAKAFPDTLFLKNFNIAHDDLNAIPGADEAHFVLHMASIASPTFYRQYPLETIDANIWGLRQLLDFYRDKSTLEGFLFFSSSEIYGDPDPARVPIAEDYRGNVACVGPRACYDESKRFGETLCHVFATKYGVPITMVRPFNNYGPGMRLEDKRLPADLARCVIEDRDIVLYSNGTPKRTFCYITDAASGYLLSLLHREFDVFNIGIEKPEITVADLAEIFCEAGRVLKGYAGTVRFGTNADQDYLEHNPQRRCPDIRKAREKLGYNPYISVEEGVRRYLSFLLAQ